MSITIEVDEDSINYETAEATVTVSGVETLPEDERNTWSVAVRTEVKGDSSTQITKNISAFGNPDANGVYSADVHLARYDGEPESDHSNLTHSLNPGKLHVVKAFVSYYNPNSRQETAQAEFTTKGTDGCVKHENEENVSWNSNALELESFRSENTLGFKIGVKRSYAPVNSGRCIHYRYRKAIADDYTGPFSIFVTQNPGNTTRRVIIRLTGLDPATTYYLDTAADKTMQNLGIGYSVRTNGALPNVDTVNVSKSSITQNSAVADVTVANPNSNNLTVHLRYYKTADKDADPRTETTDSKPTVEGPLAFNLGSLVASTSYMVDASTGVDYRPTYTKTDTFPTLPDSPTLDSVEIGDGQLKVSWTKPTGGEAIDEYIVQWKSGSQTFQDATDDVTDNREASVAHVSGTTAYQTTITGLTNGTPYTVQVIAKNESGQATSNTETKKPAGLPSAPKSLSVTPGNKQLTLSWEEPDELGGGIDGYEVQSKIADDSTAVWATSSATVASETDAQSNVTTYSTTITGLDFSTKYEVRVRAKNSVTRTNEEHYIWAESAATTIPDVPTGLESESGNQQLTFSWEEPSVLGTVAISDYVVQYRKTSEANWSTSGATNGESTDSETSVTTYSNTITGLDYSTDYDLRVRADNGVTLQDDDGYNWALFDGQTIPDSPGNFEVVPGDERLTLRWDAPADSGSLSIDGYVVQYKKADDSNAVWATSSAAVASETDAQSNITTYSTTITGLENDVRYSVRVRAVNVATLDDDEGYNWATESETPVPSPSIETVTVDANSVTQTGATVTVTLDRTNGVTQKAHVQYQTVPNGVWSTQSKPGDIDALSGDIVLDSLKGNTEYEVQAWLETDATKVKSEPFTTKPVPPGVPTNTTVTPGNTTIKLEWDPPSDDGGSTIDHYVIEWVEYLGHNWETSTLSSDTSTDEEYDITGLTNGTRYAIRLRADNLEPLPTGKSYRWVFIDATPRTIPAAPTVTVTPDKGKLHVEWTEPGNGGNAINGYVVEYSDDDKATWELHGEPGSNTFGTTIPNLENGTKYYVQVRAKNDAVPDTPGVFNWGEHHGTPRTIPAEPVITVTPGDTVLVVSWDEPDNGGSDITSHVVQYKKNTDDAWETSTATIAAETDTDTEVTSYETTIISLENGTLYDVRVRAVNVVELDNDKDYEWGEGSGKPRTIPEEPVVGVTPGNALLEVTWNKPASGGDDITGFVVQYMKNTDTDWSDHSTPGKDATSTTISGLDNGEMYTVRVRAVNSVVLENYNWGDASGTPRTIPNAPDSLTVTHGSQQLTATWTQPTGTGSNGGDTITGYEVQWKEKTSKGWSSRSFQLVTGIDTLTLTFSQHSGQSLANGTAYSVRVRAVNTVELDDEENYNWKNGEETPSTTPDAPEKVRISNQGNKELTVEWDAPVITGGDDISGYVVQWRAKGIANWEATSTTEAEIGNATPLSHTFNQHLSTDLANGLSYEARVIAKNRNGRGTPSVHVEGKPRTTPNAPTDLQVTEGNMELALTWTAPTETGGTAIDYYIVEYMKEGDTGFTSEQTTDASTNLTLDELENGKLYAIRVKSHTEGGTSEPSGTATGKPRTIPGKPDITAVTAGNGTLTVAWTGPDPTDNGGDKPSKYILEWEEWIESTTTWQYSGSQEDTNGSPSEIANLKNGTLYRVVVKAHNAAGTGPASDPEEDTPKTIPDAPVLTLTPGGGELKAKWTKPANGGDAITGFKVQYKKDTDTGWTELNELGATVLETTITGLDNGDRYTVWVRAVNTAKPDAANIYNWGKAADKPRTFPAAPSISLVHGDSQLKVTWDKPDERGADITEFVVQYKKAADSAWREHSRPAADKTTTTITGLDNGVLYDVRVRAVNSVTLDDKELYAWGKKSDTPKTIPGPVTGLGIISGDEELTVSWVAPTVENNGGAAVKRYIIQWKWGNEEYDPDSKRHTTTTDASTVSTVLEPLSNGILFSVRVRADNGETADTYNWVEDTGTPMSVPGAPTGLVVEEGDRQIKVTWVAPEETGGEGVEIERYVIQWKLETAGSWPSQNERTTTDETVLTDTITGLVNGEMYDIRVRADNNVEGQDFQWANTTGTPRTIPSEPRNLNVTAGDGQLSLTWDAPAETGGLNINQYVVQWKSGVQEYNNSDRQDTTPSRSYTIRGLTNDVLHTLRVRADNTVTVPNEENYSWETGTGPPAAAANPPPPPQRPQQPNNPPIQRSPTPSVSDVSFDNITQTSARARVSIADAGSSQKTVRLRYREDGTTRWTTVPAKRTSGASATISLRGLIAGTAYEVQAWLNGNSPPSGTQIYEFTTLDEVVPEPSISSLECGNTGQTFATAMVKIANAGTDMKEIYLKHSMDGLDSWTMLPSPSITYTDSTSINLTGLQVGTTYEVAVALTEDFNGMLTCSFTTLASDPSVSGIGISDITNTSAVATVGIADAGSSQKTVHLRYRVYGETEWGATHTETTTGSSTQFSLTSLEPQTKYEVEAALSSDFTGSKTSTFTTIVPDPSVSSVMIGSIKQTSAVATISIADPGEAQKTVHLRYKVEGAEEWSDPVLTATTYGANTTIDIVGLTADTSYEVHASLDGAFPEELTASASFSTLRYPRLSGVDVTDITKTTATAEIDIADPDGSGQLVHLRYRTSTPQGNWSSTLTTTSTTADATIKLIGLTTDTGYEVQASLTSDFAVVVSDTFNTLPPDPVVSGVGVSGITQTTATANIDIANSDGSSRTVHLRYRTTTPRGDWSATLTTTSSTDSASIDLLGLAPGTEYDVQASLDGAFPAARTKYDTFTTLRYPSIASLEAQNIGRNGATVSATIADSQGESQTVYVRHRQSRYIAWRNTQQTDSTDDIANLRLRGLS
ncbi:MAG: fibronectin type III domain-containing protein, partial [Chloroflexi bacterium]|nr:fibronectin type III domain-containing protein [Chloroflexota bacterium]